MDIMGLMFLQSGGFFGGYSGGSIGNILAVWQQAGVFSYMLPFLLLFALVYGILIQVKLFGGKEDPTGRIINGIIALAVSLLALQFDFVPRFFSEIFPRVGVGLAILLFAIILLGLFADPKSKFMAYSMYFIGAAILIIALVLSANRLGIYSYFPIGGFNWVEWLPIIAIIALIGVVVGAGKEKNTTPPDSLWVKALKGE